MTKTSMYNLENLNKYCNENNITLFGDYTETNLSRYTIISGSCIKNNCKNTFSKNFRNLFLYKGFCKICVSENNVIKRKETCIKRYGCENPQQNKEINQKTKQTCMIKYGCENPGQNEEIKNKMKETNLTKYSCFYPFQNTLIKNKIKSTFISKYGVEYPTKCDIVKQKIINTNLKKYGAEHFSQNENIMEKISKNAYKLKEYIFPSGNIIKIQGYEYYALDELIVNKNIEEIDIITGVKNVPTIWYNDENGKKHRHYVDIFIPSQNKCIEVKSTWTAKKKEHIIFLKQKAAKELGYKYEIWVYNNKGDKTCYE